MATVDIVKTVELSTPLEYNGKFVGINNMFYYGFEIKSQQFYSNTAYTFTATVPTGYKFLCWCCYMTEGWIGNGYIHNKNQQTTDFFFSRNPGKGNLRLTYLCIRA
jgi:hypothetical protein